MLKVIFYLLVTVVALIVAAVFVLWLLYGDSPWPPEPPRVVEGGRALRAVTLDPMGLTIRRGEGGWSLCRGFELRVLEEGGEKSVLIRGTLFQAGVDFVRGADAGAGASPAGHEYSDDTYAVALGGDFGVRKVDAAAWARARKLKPEESETEFGAGASRRFTFHGGETLPPGGVTKGGLPLMRLGLGGAEPSGWLLSEGGRYAAGFSHTSRRRRFKRPQLMPFSGEDDRIMDGTMYFELFDGVTGERLARATKGHKGSYEMLVFRQAVWFDGRYFAAPLDTWLGSWLVGALPE